MILLGVKKENDWLLSTFNLTYPASWESICKVVSKAYDFYENTEILVDEVAVDIDAKDQILKLSEAGSLTIRGMSKIVKVPIMITFFNQLKTVNVTVPCMTDEFMEADYRKFNLSLGEYMDSLELSAYIK